MDLEIKDNRIKLIADHYGFDEQCIQAIEEMAELTQALTKYHRYGDNRPDITEEIADVLVMIQQLQYLLDIDQAEINKNIEEKLTRQISRMEMKR